MTRAKKKLIFHRTKLSMSTPSAIGFYFIIENSKIFKYQFVERDMAMMKIDATNLRLIALLSILLIGVVLVSGCAYQGGKSTTSQPTKTQPTKNNPSISDYYTGFITPKKGAWVEWEITSNGKTIKTRYVYAGKATIEGKNAYGFEYNYNINGQEAAAQMWFSNEGIIKSVIKYQGQVICYSLPKPSITPSAETPQKYEPEEISKKPELGFDTFTTKTGKTVKVVKFSEIRDGKLYEVWISSEVPFGIVKMVSGGKTVMELADFGFGAKLTITKEEVDNCMQINIPNIPTFGQ